jgi:hypothetical protein
MYIGTTLTNYIIETQRQIQGATGEFTGLLNDIAVACKKISDLVNKGDLLGVLGSAESENVQGETQKKLDVITNEVFMRRCAQRPRGRPGLGGNGRDLPIPGQYPLGTLPGAVRPAGRLVEHRRERLGRHHLLDPQGPRRRPTRHRGLPAARAPSRCAPATASTARRP